MKKLNTLSESDFLKLVFAFFTAALLIAAICMPDRTAMLSGLWQIISQPNKISTNYFSLGGYAAAFLNAGLVSLLYLALYVLTDTKVNHVSTLAFFLNIGFAFWGINILNLIPGALGVMLYAAVKKEKLSTHSNAVLFSAGLCPLISDLLVRYPNAEAIGFNALGFPLALAVGMAIGFVLPAGMSQAARVHKGFDLYSAALPMGLAGLFFQCLLYKTMGVALPAAPAADTLKVASAAVANIFCGITFCCCVLAALLMGYTFRDYGKQLMDCENGVSTSSRHGNAGMLMNLGMYGLFILAYYNVIGATFNAVTLGLVFCMVACCNAGSNPYSTLPIIAGYVITSTLLQYISPLLGGSFAMTLTSQAIMGGLCYANGLSPITRKYGYLWGFAAGILHYLLVTTIPSLHGGYLLHNGGFTAAIVCMTLIPLMETFGKKEELKQA